jgi:hypothetical protein
MSSKKYDGIKRVNEMINVKLKKTGESVHLFITMARDYNALGEKYNKKSEYFSDIDKNPIKFYSFTKNQDKYQKVMKM